MADEDDDNKNNEEALKTERLKSALWYSIGQIVDEDSLRLNINATPQFIGALTEMVWAQIGRTTIDMSDVLLLARRNEGLESLLRNFADGLQAGKAKGKGKGGRR
ncbi:hypothetical protein B0A49_05969 [Cryomyces minteri]|uniref:Uncharacterized protein n=1 Tax=Cryomyces minteri TaxID=331657 RepID=A0A4U0WNZ1_9PEZI|nr:hypothetical protein B0A49_05969 [Cryomyces minteri]